MEVKQSSFMTIWVADMHVHAQRLLLVVKMATVLEECTSAFP
jgi:hypothetical protein